MRCSCCWSLDVLPHQHLLLASSSWMRPSFFLTINLCGHAPTFEQLGVLFRLLNARSANGAASTPCCCRARASTRAASLIQVPLCLGWICLRVWRRLRMHLLPAAAAGRLSLTSNRAGLPEGPGDLQEAQYCRGADNRPVYVFGPCLKSCTA